MEIRERQQESQKYTTYAHSNTFSQILFVVHLNTDLSSELQCGKHPYLKYHEIPKCAFRQILLCTFQRADFLLDQKDFMTRSYLLTK